MPGVRLNDTERRLMEWWERGAPPTATLRQIEIKGRPGLRGISSLRVQFEYPLAVLCGRNGNGKTTLLALAALAFGGIADHYPPGALRKPPRGQNFNYYTFRDFFFRGPGDPDVSGVRIDWNYAGHLVRQNGKPAPNQIVVTKNGNKWMRYERRPSKPVTYVGVSRSIPAAEQRVLRSHFAGRSSRQTRSPLSGSYRDRLQEIMGRPYEDAEVVTSSRYALRSAESDGSSYSSFNMGAGEDIAIELLHTLQETPEGSLVVIEEIELGLHPEALIRLAEHLQQIMLDKKLQVVVSTHSSEFLDAVPRKARILIQRHGTVHEATHGPTARFAGGRMAGRADPEAHIYCEDAMAERVIGAALTSGLRARVKILPIGSDSELPSLARFHQRIGMGELQALIWDGDFSDRDLRRALQRAADGGLSVDRISWMRLPGGDPPEKWLLSILDCDEGHRLLAEELRSTPNEAAGLLRELRAVIDPHDVVHEMRQKTQLREDEAAQKLIAAAQKLTRDPFATIREFIVKVLDGMVVQEPLLVDDDREDALALDELEAEAV